MTCRTPAWVTQAIHVRVVQLIQFLAAKLKAILTAATPVLHALVTATMAVLPVPPVESPAQAKEVPIVDLRPNVQTSSSLASTGASFASITEAAFTSRFSPEAVPAKGSTPGASTKIFLR